MSSKTLLISPDGMLGRAFHELLSARDVSLRTATWPEFDITSASSIEEHARPGLDLVINCSAWTDVDGAEAREEGALEVNGEGVGALARRCQELGALLIHFSTDYVFDGAASTPYVVDHSRAPENAYGRTKARGEVLIEASGCEFLLLRTSWLYAPWGQNFVRTMARLATERDALRVVDDQLGRPTSAEHLAETTMALVDGGHRGIFHVTDGGECSWFELASLVIGLVQPGCKVEPCTTGEFPRPAKRPLYSVLDLSGTEAALGRPMPAWQDTVRGVVARLEPL